MMTRRDRPTGCTSVDIFATASGNVGSLLGALPSVRVESWHTGARTRVSRTPPSSASFRVPTEGLVVLDPLTAAGGLGGIRISSTREAFLGGGSASEVSSKTLHERAIMTPSDSGRAEGPAELQITTQHTHSSTPYTHRHSYHFRQTDASCGPLTRSGACSQTCSSNRMGSRRRPPGT